MKFFNEVKDLAHLLKLSKKQNIPINYGLTMGSESSTSHLHMCISA